MKKFFLSLAVFVMALCANAQTNQYFWYNGNLMMGNPIAQIDSVTFGNEDTDSIMIYLPRTIIKEVHDTLYITIHDTICPNDVPEGALNGIFSVSADKKVRFSKGNLQYQASTDTWRFAENQYDVIGNANNANGSTNEGWIDLFGWGTGDNPTLNSTDNNDYLEFVDWGKNLISNGGSIRNLWRTLSKEEWNYLFSSRPNASSLFGFGNVNGIKGVILLPDNWEIPLDLSFVASEDQGIYYIGDRYYCYNGLSVFITNNVYTIEEWQTMESQGAIFFPATHLSLYSTPTKGNYWSSSSPSINSAYNLWFDRDGLDPQDNAGEDNHRYDANAVRLIQDVK